MTSEDLPRLQALVKTESDPVIKAAAEGALLSILNGPKREQEARDRDQTWRDASGVIGVITAIAVLTVGIAKSLNGSLTKESGLFLGAGLTFSGALLTFRLKSLFGSKDKDA